MAFRQWFLLLAAASTCLAQLCGNPVESHAGYRLCAPTGWYQRTMHSGAVFLCNEPHGNCTTSVGGMPLPGRAMVSVVPLRSARKAEGGHLRRLAESEINDSSADISEMMRIPGRNAEVEYVVATRSFSLGSLNEVTKCERSYFLSVHGRLFRITLLFNSDDKRRREYQKITESIMKSIVEAAPAPHGQ